MKKMTEQKWNMSKVAGMVFLLLAAVMVLVTYQIRTTSKSGTTPLEVARTNLVLVEGRLRLNGNKDPFSGVMVEHYPGGQLMSRSGVTNGLLNGISLGYYTNSQIQVEENFRDGVSHGIRKKWYSDGAKESETQIVDGQLNGPFIKWYPNGGISEMAHFENGQPQGESKAFFPSGFLKARMVMEDGKPIDQQFWKDGEMASQ